MLPELGPFPPLPESAPPLPEPLPPLPKPGPPALSLPFDAGRAVAVTRTGVLGIEVMETGVELACTVTLRTGGTLVNVGATVLVMSATGELVNVGASVTVTGAVGELVDVGDGVGVGFSR